MLERFFLHVFLSAGAFCIIMYPMPICLLLVSPEQIEQFTYATTILVLAAPIIVGFAVGIINFLFERHYARSVLVT